LSSDCDNLREIIDTLKKGENDVGLLLIQDGVFMADKGCSESAGLHELKLTVYACKNHVEERGIGDRLVDDAKLVAFPEIINIIMEEYDKVISL
jgi:sulfur relay protein TusB/DsrH